MPKDLMKQPAIVIEAVSPIVDCGRYPSKHIQGERIVVEADIFRHGHHSLNAVVKWKKSNQSQFQESPMHLLDNDRWQGHFLLEEKGHYFYTVEAWTAHFASWLADFRKWVKAEEKNIASEMAEGLKLLTKVLENAQARDKTFLESTLNNLQQSLNDPKTFLGIVSDQILTALVNRLETRKDASVYDPYLEIIADQRFAVFSAWYEMFPRSQGTQPGQSATFREAEARLKDIQEMGFDIVYLAPIHPIGITNRKGPNNSLSAGPNDPGSPWAIGNENGGHMSIEPGLGTLDDFKHFLHQSHQNGLEVALDFAIQCSPDHPWVKEHPEWFYQRPDGTIKYAENPPKKYQDIYPLNFDIDNPEHKKALWEEMLKVILFWIDQGVKIFRVDNPHTKPVVFWQWLISQVQAQHPETIFLSEAFTRPKMMKALAKAGFTQSYTYFTWRNTKTEFVEYLNELAHSDMSEYFRPNFFTNTPDVLPSALQQGGRPAFKMKLVLAATLSPSYGIYSGYELCEHDAIAGTEEYEHSEKYEIKIRDWNKPGNIKAFIKKINQIRRENPALQELTNLRFFPSDNENILFYAKNTADNSNVILIAVNLDPWHTHDCTVKVPLQGIGVTDTFYEVQDLITDAKYRWTDSNYVRLDPNVEPAHILRVIK